MVTTRITKNEFDDLIISAYNDYTNNFLGYDDVPSIEWFIDECENNIDFSNRFGCRIVEEILSDEQRYNIWFNNNYETGMERYFDPNNLPNFEDSYYEPTPNRTREPYPLPKLVFGKTYEFFKSLGEDLSLITHLDSSDFEIEGYQSHPVIKAPLSN
jgi:hypothetical protein